MFKRTVALSFLALIWNSLALASGELTVSPGYYFNAAKFDISRVGLFVNEALSGPWTYMSWTGSGKVFLKDPSIPEVRWYSTTQDVTYRFNERWVFGGGASLSYADPSHNTDADVHVRLAVKLW